MLMEVRSVVVSCRTGISWVSKCHFAIKILRMSTDLYPAILRYEGLPGGLSWTHTHTSRGGPVWRIHASKSDITDTHVRGTQPLLLIVESRRKAANLAAASKLGGSDTIRLLRSPSHK